ncbi:unnamed protein product, partial [Amoebophrya sp. A120]
QLPQPFLAQQPQGGSVPQPPTSGPNVQVGGGEAGAVGAISTPEASTGVGEEDDDGEHHQDATAGDESGTTTGPSAKAGAKTEALANFDVAPAGESESSNPPPPSPKAGPTPAPKHEALDGPTEAPAEAGTVASAEVLAEESGVTVSAALEGASAASSAAVPSPAGELQLQESDQLSSAVIATNFPPTAAPGSPVEVVASPGDAGPSLSNDGDEALTADADRGAASTGSGNVLLLPTTPVLPMGEERGDAGHTSAVVDAGSTALATPPTDQTPDPFSPPVSARPVTETGTLGPQPSSAAAPPSNDLASRTGSLTPEEAVLFYFGDEDERDLEEPVARTAAAGSADDSSSGQVHPQQQGASSGSAGSGQVGSAAVDVDQAQTSPGEDGEEEQQHRLQRTREVLDMPSFLPPPRDPLSAIELTERDLRWRRVRRERSRYLQGSWLPPTPRLPASVVREKLVKAARANGNQTKHVDVNFIRAAERREAEERYR